MITYAYKLTDLGNLNFGYVILKSGRTYMKQNVLPNSGELMNEITATQLAKLIVLKLQRGLTPVVTIEEEVELSTTVVSDERLIEMVDTYQTFALGSN